MARFDFCGGSYAVQSLNADAQKTLNLYRETGGPASKSSAQMYNTPGIALFASISATDLNRTNGIYEALGRGFCVIGTSLYEVFSDGSSVNRGNVGNDGNSVSLVNSQTQLLICSTGKMYVYQLNTNVFVGQVGAGLGVTIAQVEYSDGFAFALQANSQTVYQSAVGDLTSWSAGTFTIVSVFANNIVGMKVSQRELFLMSSNRAIAYADAGNSPFAFAPNLASAMEQGTVSGLSMQRLDNTLFWLSQTEQGSLIANRLQGYNPVRISTFALEQAWQKYSVVSDVQSWTYQEAGHLFWVITFPTVKATWVYDVAENQWHERGWLNPQTGQVEHVLQLSHAYLFGLHLVGSRIAGNIYQQSIAFVDDDGLAIRRVRRAPHISTEQYRIRHHQLQIDLEAGENPGIQPWGGVTATRVAVTPGSNVPIGNLGALDALVMAVLRDGTRLTAYFPNVLSDTGHQIRFDLPAAPNIASLRVYFAPTGTTQTYVYTLPINSALPGYTFTPAGGGFVYLAPTLLVPTTVSIAYLANNTDLNPTLMLRWSDDGGHTWSNERLMNVGKVGQYAYRCITWRLGMSRDRVYEAAISDPIAPRFVDAYLQADGFQPTERLAAQLRKQA